MKTLALATVLSLLQADALFQAARDGDLAAIETAVKGGADVNAKTKYGATALAYASDKGHLAVVQLLLDRGADPNVKDSFYNATPLGWALSGGHLDVAKLLLKRGAIADAQALRVAVQKKDADLVKAALASGGIDAEGIQSALTLAERAGATEIAALLKSSGGRPPDKAPVSVDPKLLRTYAGTYRTDEGFVVRVAVVNDGLTAQAAGQPPLTLSAVDETTFKAIELPGISLAFNGRGGMIERMFLKQGETVTMLPRVSEEDAKPAPSPAPSADRSSAPAERLPPAPWPSFRGRNTSGVADGQGAPLTWNGSTGTNIRWKTPIPGIANSSPIIWGDRVFVTTAVSASGNDTFRTGLYGDVDSVNDVSKHSFRVYALDRKTGRVLWDRTVEEQVPEVKRHLKSSLANSTPATDGERVISFFGPIGLLVCHDIDGKELWRKNLGAMDSGWFYDPSYQWGFGSSPVLHEGLVILQVDKQKGSFIAAFDVKTGKEAWRTPREDEISTWGTPALLIQGETREVVTNGTRIRGYDPATGKVLWTLGPNSEVTVGSPVVGDGLVYVTAGYPPVRPVYAIRPGGRGDLSLPEGKESSAFIPWSKNRGGTYIPTPLVYKNQLYTFGNEGRLTAYDAATGERIYQQRVGTEGAFAASPIAADGRLYFTSEEGKTYVVRAGRDFEVVAENELGEVVMATPAISDGMLIVRTLKHVFGISP